MGENKIKSAIPQRNLIDLKDQPGNVANAP